MSTEDKDLFYKLNWSLLFYVNKKYPVIKGINTPDGNPFNFSQDELEIVKSWKNFVKGRFYIVTHLKNHTIFLQADEQKAYGVIGLSDEIENITLPYEPSLVDTVLLPFKGRTIHYGLFQFHNILFGGGIKKNIKGYYQTAKSKFGIIVSLDTQLVRLRDRMKNYSGFMESRWFGIFEDIILASGQTEQEVKAQVDSLLPEPKRDCVYIFRHVLK